MLNSQSLEKYLYEQIPISQALGVTVTKLSLEEIVLSAPLSNNVNHKRTVFGGSLQSIATLVCWCLLHVNLKNFIEPSEIVITHSNIDYLIGVTHDFEARCILPEKDLWDYFIKTLNRKGKARIQLIAQIFQEEKLAVHYQGIFAALTKD